MQPVTAQRRLARLQTHKVDSMPGPRRIEGFAIVSEDGMLANAEGIMPDSLKFEADRQFFECGLDGSMWWCMGATLMNDSRVRTCATD